MITDLLFYQASVRTGEFYITERGRINLLRQHTNWRTSWKQIIPGNFGGKGLTDLLFYDPSTGTGEFYTVDGIGGISLLQQHTDWRGSWNRIVPGNFGGSGLTDLLFYDASAGVGEFYITNGPGQITLLRQHTGWRDSWSQIIPGNFGGSSATDLLFYDASAGTGEFYATNQGEISSLEQHTNLRANWNQIIPGVFAPLRAVRLHLKVLFSPKDPIETVISAMREVYVTAGIRVIIGSIENLNLPQLLDIDVGNCSWDLIGDNITGDVNDLYEHRHGVDKNDIAIYFVRTTTNTSLAGCADYPNDKAGAVITRFADRWVVAHEVGHVLGLGHVDNRDRLMNPVDNFTNPPPDLSGDEKETMRDSEFTRTL
jgi:hypothetical protein